MPSRNVHATDLDASLLSDRSRCEHAGSHSTSVPRRPIEGDLWAGTFRGTSLRDVLLSGGTHPDSNRRCVSGRTAASLRNLGRDSERSARLAPPLLVAAPSAETQQRLQRVRGSENPISHLQQDAITTNEARQWKRCAWSACEAPGGLVTRGRKEDRGRSDAAVTAWFAPPANQPAYSGARFGPIRTAIPALADIGRSPMLADLKKAVRTVAPSACRPDSKWPTTSGSQERGDGRWGACSKAAERRDGR